MKQQNNEQLIETRNLFIEFNNIIFLFSQSDSETSPLQTDIQFYWCLVFNFSLPLQSQTEPFVNVRLMLGQAFRWWWLYDEKQYRRSTNNSIKPKSQPNKKTERLMTKNNPWYDLFVLSQLTADYLCTRIGCNGEWVKNVAYL